MNASDFVRALSRLGTRGRRALYVGVTGLAMATLGSVSFYSAEAAEVNAGDYTAAPAGTNLALLYYTHGDGGPLYSDGHNVDGNAGLGLDVSIARFVHFVEIGGIIADPQILIPFGRVEGNGSTSYLGSDGGVGDITLASTFWFYNNPETKTYFGVTPYIVAPTGSYDADKALNLGENRWKFILQAGYVKPLSDKWIIDLIADVTFYSDNNSYGVARSRLEQDAVVQGQGWLRYALTESLDLRGGLLATFGGNQKIDGVSQHNEAEDVSIRAGFGYFLSEHNQLIATYGRDLIVNNGFKYEDQLNLRLLHIF